MTGPATACSSESTENSRPKKIRNRNPSDEQKKIRATKALHIARKNELMAKKLRCTKELDAASLDLQIEMKSQEMYAVEEKEKYTAGAKGDHKVSNAKNVSKKSYWKASARPPPIKRVGRGGSLVGERIQDEVTYTQ